MSLTPSQYNAIQMEYDARQARNHREHLARLEEIGQRLPAYAEADEELVAVRRQRIALALGSRDTARTAEVATEQQLGQAQLAQANSLADTASLIATLKQQEQTIALRKKQILQDAGYSVDYLDPIYTCAKCQDTGFLTATRQRCRCFMTLATEQLMRASGIYHRLQQQNFEALSFDGIDPEHLAEYQDTVATAKKFVQNFTQDYQNLMFYGSVGTGKTYLSDCIAGALMQQGVSVLYLSAPSLFKDLVDLRFGEDKQDYMSFVDSLQKADLLVIDDLGTEKTSDTTRADLFEILTRRDLAKKATIISCNLKPHELGDRYSERILSRIGGVFTPCEFRGRDMRG